MSGHTVGLDAELAVRDNIIRGDPPVQANSRSGTNGRIDDHRVIESSTGLNFTQDGHQIVDVINNGGANKGTTARFVIREDADVLIPAFPDPINLAGRLGVLIHNTIAASGRNDEMFVFRWLQAAWDTEDTSAIHPSPDSLRSLEMKLFEIAHSTQNCRRGACARNRTTY